MNRVCYKKIRRSFLLLSATLLIFLHSCVSDVDVKTGDAEPRLIVFGLISQDTTRHYVNITKSMSYFSQDPPKPLKATLVTISHENKTDTLLPDTLAGRYYIDSLSAKVANRYTLDIYLDFNGDGKDEHYQAKTIMPNNPRVDSIEFSDFVIKKLPIMIVYGKAFMDTENNFCLYNWKNSDTIGLFNYFMLMPSKFLIITGDKYPLPYYVKKGIKTGDTLHLRIDNFNNQYATFIANVSSETNIPTPFFSAPPAEVYTNIKCLDADTKVSGIFAAYSRGKIFSVISKVDFSYK